HIGVTRRLALQGNRGLVPGQRLGRAPLDLGLVRGSRRRSSGFRTLQLGLPLILYLAHCLGSAALFLDLRFLSRGGDDSGPFCFLLRRTSRLPLVVLLLPG